MKQIKYSEMLEEIISKIGNDHTILASKEEVITFIQRLLKTIASQLKDLDL